MPKLIVIHDIKNPEVFSVMDFNYNNWRENRYACLTGIIDAIAIIKKSSFKVWFSEDLRDPKTYFEAKRFGELEE